LKTYLMTNWRRISYRGYKSLLRDWQWEWVIHLTFKQIRLSEKVVKDFLIRWTRELCKCEGIQVGYFCMFSFNWGHPHLHLLMIGRNKNGKTLLEVSKSEWEKNWPYNAKIEIPRSNKKVAKYVAANFFWSKSTNPFMEAYNIKLLNKYRITA
jgi:hypothetical protein